MSRILFVDDERRVLEGIQNLLFDREDWELMFALSGEGALQVLRSGPRFDVLVTDMRMPGMDGVTLLDQVRVEFPHMMRIVLSGDAELQHAMQALTLAHLYLGKPCDEQGLVTSIERVLAIGREISNPQLRAILGVIPDTPRDPGLLELVEDLALAGVATSDLADLIAADCGLATKLVQAATSPLYGGSSVSTVAGAVERIGRAGVAALARSLHAYGRAVTNDAMPVLQQRHHQVEIARVAAALTTDPDESERAYLCGLLHDIGTLTLLSHVPDGLERCHARWIARDARLIDIQRQELGIDHAKLGAAILDVIGMTDVAHVIRFHHTPSLSGAPARLDALGALHIADAVSAGVEHGPVELDDDYITALGPAADVALSRARELLGAS